MQASATAEDQGLERFDRYYLKSPSGTLHFNLAGRTRLAPWFARHGYSLQSCKTEADFHAALRQILATEIDSARSQLTDLLSSPDIRADERAALEALLNKPKT